MIGQPVADAGTRQVDDGRPVFSVIMPTRDRPALFRVALESVLRQGGASLEVVVINDGSTAPFQEAYATIERELGRAAGSPVTYVHLEHLAKGHGQSHALNLGAQHASGRYLCFLDDDDMWTDDHHLARAQAALAEAGEGVVDLMLFDQAAFRGAERLTRPIWLEDLGERLKAGGGGAIGETYQVTPEQLLTAVGFSHVNVTIVAADLFRRIGGFNKGLFYECDRDFYLRAIDAATLILYCPEVVARHNVPDPAKAVNMSTRARPLEKHMCQFILLNHASFTARHPAIRVHARRHRRYALLKALKAGTGMRDLGRIGAIVTRSTWHELGNRLGGRQALPAGPEGV